jgi:hypothetical protein
MAGFIVQIYKTLTDAMKSRYPHWGPRDKPVYTVITTLEEWYAFGDRILSALDEKVANKLVVENIGLAIMKDYPYTICAVEDFELAIQVMRQTGIKVFMDKKVTGEHRLSGMYPFLGSTFRDEFAEVRDNNLFPEDWLSLSEIKSEHSDGVIRRELESEECARWPEQPVGPAHPCSGKGVFAHRCNRPYKKGGGDAGVVRRRRRHGQDIPAGSSQSAVPYGHSAMAIAARWADHECPWREAAV